MEGGGDDDGNVLLMETANAQSARHAAVPHVCGGGSSLSLSPYRQLYSGTRQR